MRDKKSIKLKGMKLSLFVKVGLKKQLIFLMLMEIVLVKIMGNKFWV